MIDERMERKKYDGEYINRYGIDLLISKQMITLAQSLFYRLQSNKI